MKTYLGDNPRYSPHEWAKSNFNEVRDETFIMTTNAAEQLHALLKIFIGAGAGGSLTLKTSVNIIHQLMVAKLTNLVDFMTNENFRNGLDLML